MLRNLSNYIFIIGASFIVASCGGSSSSTDSSVIEQDVENSAITLKKEPMIELNETITVTVADRVAVAPKVIDSDGSIMGYEWRQLSGPSIHVADLSKAELNFIAPSVPDKDIRFELTVTDNDNKTATSEINIEVTPVYLWNYYIVGNIRYDKNSKPLECRRYELDSLGRFVAIGYNDLSSDEDGICFTDDDTYLDSLTTFSFDEDKALLRIYGANEVSSECDIEEYTGAYPFESTLISFGQVINTDETLSSCNINSTLNRTVHLSLIHI